MSWKSELVDSLILLFRWIPKVANVFFDDKPIWYSISTSGAKGNKEEGYQRLDNFFKSVASLMSNQLWSILRASLDDFENFFMQFKNASSEIALFQVSLTLSNNAIRFEPSFSDVEMALNALLKEITAAVSQIPRIESKLFTSFAKEPMYLPAFSAADIIQVKDKMIRSILSRNAVSPQKHVMVYDKFKGVWTQRMERHIEDFVKDKQHELHTYEEV